MSIIEKLSMRLAKQLQAAGSSHSVGELSHGIEIMMLNFLNTFFLLLLALLFGCFTEVSVATAAYILIRNFTGGVHFSNPWSCLLFGNLLLFAIGWFTSYLPMTQPVMIWTTAILSWILGYTINYRHAPAPNMYFKFNPVQIKQNRSRALLLIACLGILSLLFGCFGYLPILLAMNLAILLQAILLHPVTFSIVKKIGW
ncbi:accessory gene regulator B family protein [Brevibacillus ginsengisoli]|uniref:accessory gene regulator B family protein n=1 Tax=Brevibacillus ginsengisoli TaxID=363854 RepID=UPI003CFABDEB